MSYEINKKTTLTLAGGPTYANKNTIGYTLFNGDGSSFQALTTTGVAEAPAGSGSYRVELAANIFTAFFDGYAAWYDAGVAIPGAIDPIYVSDRIDATISSRATPAEVDVQVDADLAPLQATVDAIKARTDLLGSQLVSMVGPLVAAGRVEIIQGDDYANADGRALTWTDDNAAWPDLTGHTAIFIIEGALEKAATVVDGNTVRVELTAAETGALAVKAYDFSLAATLAAGRKVTLLEGLLAVDAPVNGP